MRSFVEALLANVETSPRASAATFCPDTGEPADDQTLTYAGLDHAARARAAWLQERFRPGDRAMLLYPAGPEFLPAFMACLYAGIVPVPAPAPGADRQQFQRTAGVARDAQVSVVLTTSDLGIAVKEHLDHWGPDRIPMVASNDEVLGDAEAWTMPSFTYDSVAFLQYTSGSTMEPKGVMVTHGNMLHQQAAVTRRLGSDRELVLVGWLPHFHDMGLIGQLLHPIYVGGSSVFMAPGTFLRRPVRWLDLVTRSRGTLIVAPDFAYDLCTRTITDQQLASIDLSSVRHALNGAEPVRAATLDRFSRRFESTGFRPDTFTPCYGMAEATLMAAAKELGTPPTFYSADPHGLEHGEMRPGTTPEAVRLVGCGSAATLDVRIVDPERREVLAPGRIGEIWLRGGSVAAGYWNQPDASREVFDAHTSDGQGPFLRTGDLGALIDDVLYVTGRLKDLLIVHGRNLHPQDLEYLTQEIHPALAAGSGAAFQVSDDQEHIVIVHEIKSVLLEGLEMAELAKQVKRTVARSLDLPAPSVVLTNRGGVRRTTSGKVQRQLMRNLFLNVELKVLHEDLTDAVRLVRRGSGTPPPPSATR